MTGADPVLSALQRCTRKAASASDGRGVSGAVREARNGLQHAGVDATTAGRMAEAAGRLGLQLALAARRAHTAIVAELTGAAS